MKINNFYNFKNPVRHFLDISKITSNVDTKDVNIEHLSWTEPINFRIKKENGKYRSLKMPNVLNFICSYEQFKGYEDFLKPSNMDIHKRLVPNLYTGDFATGVYDSQLESDFQELCIYDNLLKLDIKSYYGRIYTHHIKFEKKGDENYLSNLNMGNTNGLIMGNYISLYFAEKYLTEISKEIEYKLNEEGIDCKFSYFSDDFYFFCNQNQNEKIINIFDTVLESYNLERNDGKVEIWTYLDYNEYHLMEKYWKKIVSESKIRYNDEKDNNKLYFVNQLIYRMSNLKDYKLKKIFLNTFFKSTYFQQLDITKYELEEFNCHQLCYMFKLSPEIMIYSINHFKQFDYFKSDIFKKFLSVRYNEVLYKPYNEEQLYYYYAIKVLGFDSILIQACDSVYKSNNQILISYYLKDNLFNEKIISKLKDKKDERYWLQNYHLILYSDLKDDLENSIKQYLVPEFAEYNPDDESKRKQSRKIKQEAYVKFYKSSLDLNLSMIRDIDHIENKIKKYIELKIDERKIVFGEDEN